jgi:putative transposase
MLLTTGWRRDELLNEEVFDTLAGAREMLERWWHDYNHVRSHSALGVLTHGHFGSTVRMTG